ncbi:serine/threonine-protein phosphatase 7 long form [Dorcoceras hygrometricum]|uniref:Serine/threonine-protein phosphatase 7 long form n=1 Tax=Dorcoceras hygrometricum TaxID=472368 RepID=A0A2Z7BQR9_9LAMI|nr:serine/threonine-protein phosphatase 7 long form [Dorcoceras hygrometricum]
MRISRSITFSQLIHDVHRMLTIDPFKFHIKLSTKYSYNMMAIYIEQHVHITDDDSLQFMLDLPTLGCLYLYVETLPVDDDVAHDEILSHSYPSSRTASEQWLLMMKQGRLHIMVTDMDHRHCQGATWSMNGGSNTTRLDDVITGDWDHYITSATEEDVVWGSTVATGSVFQEYHGEYTTYATNVQEPNDLFGDNAQNVPSSKHSIEGSIVRKTLTRSELQR